MYCVIYSTAGSECDAEKIADILLSENLAACVNFWKIKSIYRWQGKIQKEDETAMLIKTNYDLSDKVIARIKELHSYDVPEIICLEIKNGLDSYLDWIDSETKKEKYS